MFDFEIVVRQNETELFADLNNKSTIPFLRDFAKVISMDGTYML